MEKILARRPKRVKEVLGEKSKICLLSAQDIFKVLIDKKVIIMACNIRIKHAVPGIMKAAEELDAVVAFELARSEGNLKGGYTGQTPYTFFEMVTGYAKELNFKKPFFIHADHTAVRNTSEPEVNTAMDIIKAAIDAGYTSVSIDASHNEMKDNIALTTKVGRMVQDAGLGLEVEIGEIKLVKEGGALSTVAESVEFIEGLKKNGINPDLLAINNGSKHGNYAPGEQPHIDLKRTKEIFDAVRPHGVCIAQHGITGTPLDTVGQFADYGIRKGNVGTEWQNVVYDHMPEGLMKELRGWAEENKADIKKATKPFKEKIDNIPDVNKKAICDDAYKRAANYIKAFRAAGTAGMVVEGLK